MIDLIIPLGLVCGITVCTLVAFKIFFSLPHEHYGTAIKVFTIGGFIGTLVGLLAIAGPTFYGTSDWLIVSAIIVLAIWLCSTLIAFRSSVLSTESES